MGFRSRPSWDLAAAGLLLGAVAAGFFSGGLGWSWWAAWAAALPAGFVLAFALFRLAAWVGR